MRIRKEIKIGIYAVLMVGVLYWGINFLKGKDFFSNDVTYYATYGEDIGDLSTSAAVFIKGVRVGIVKKISYNPTVSDDIVLTLNIKPKYRIPADSKAVIFNNGLMGGRAVRIDLGKSEKLAMDGDTIGARVHRDLMETASDEIGYFKDVLAEVADNLNTTLVSLNKLLSENTDGLGSTIDNLNSLSAGLNDVVRTQKDGLKGTLDNINALSASLRANARSLDRVMAGAEKLTDSTGVQSLPYMVSNLNRSIDQLNVALAAVNNAKGTAGLLVHDRALYDSLTRASADLTILLEDINKNPKRYVHFSVFGGGKKDEK